MQVGALSFVPISQEISDSKVGQVSEGFGSILSTLTNPEKNLPENRNLDGDGKVLEGENLPILKEELQQLIQFLIESINQIGILCNEFTSLSTLLKSVNLEKDGIRFYVDTGRNRKL